MDYRMNKVSIDQATLSHHLPCYHHRHHLHLLVFNHVVDNFLNQGRILPDNVVIRELPYGLALFPVLVRFLIPEAPLVLLR